MTTGQKRGAKVRQNVTDLGPLTHLPGTRCCGRYFRPRSPAEYASGLAIELYPWLTLASVEVSQLRTYVALP